MTEVHCPACGEEVLIVDGIIGRASRWMVELFYGRFVHCTNCTLVSEFADNRLIDLSSEHKMMTRQLNRWRES